MLSAAVYSGGDVRMSVKLHKSGWRAITQPRRNRYRQTGVYTTPLPPEKDLGKGRLVIECSLCCVITGCRVIFQKWHWCAGVKLTSLSEL